MGPVGDFQACRLGRYWMVAPKLLYHAEKKDARESQGTY